MTRVLVTGANGQVATVFASKRPEAVVLQGLTRAECDVANPMEVEVAVRKFGPDVVVNLAAFNAVDQAESDPETSFAVNAEGPGNIARAAEERGARVVHVSTDYVFDGERNTPYPANATPRPLNVYGASKLQGERLTVQNSSRALVVRTAWVFSPMGHNFVLRILQRLAAGEATRVVNDQRGAPTSAEDLADVLWRCVQTPELTGTFHFTNAGSTTSFEFAEEIRSIAIEIGVLDRATPIEAVTSAEYGAPARRPKYSVLDSSALVSRLGVGQRDWRAALRDVIGKLEPSVGTRPS